MTYTLLDLYCGAGGAATGYARAGFRVVGVDVNPQPNYPFEFVQNDAIQYLESHGKEFDIVHASPPCQGYSTATPDQTKHERLIGPTREALIRNGKPYVIENVAGAKRFMVDPARLCGSNFGLRVQRHRYFETDWGLKGLPCEHQRFTGRPVGVYGDKPETRTFLRPDGRNRGVKATSLTDASDAMGGMDWMTWRELAESIPPDYTEWIGRRWMHGIV